MIERKVLEIGTHWKRIAPFLPGRPASSVKNRHCALCACVYVLFTTSHNKQEEKITFCGVKREELCLTFSSRLGDNSMLCLYGFPRSFIMPMAIFTLDARRAV